MNPIESALANIRAILQCQTKQIVIAYSGGVDSHVLLHLAASLQPEFLQHRFLAVHVNHGLQNEADNWQKHCERQCSALSMPFKGVRVNVDTHCKKGIEAAARAQRYQALFDCAEHDSVILLGQHVDDQAETVLLQLKRGAGPKGLSAMPEEHLHHSGTRLVRPLLYVGRAQLEEYADKHQLHWIEDPSNQDSRFDRNFLRRQVMPLLKERWPGFSRAVARSAALNAQQQTLLEEVCDTRLQLLIDEKGALLVDALTQYSQAWQSQLVRTWLSQKRIPMPSKAVMEALQNVLNAKPDATPIVQWQNWQFRRFRGKLFCIKASTPLAADELIECNDRKIIHPNGSGTLHFTDQVVKNIASIAVHKSVFSDKFKPQNSKVSKPLKQWFKVWDVAPWHREQSLTLTFDNVAVAIWVDGKVFFSIDMPTCLTDQIHLHNTHPVL